MRILPDRVDEDTVSPKRRSKELRPLTIIAAHLLILEKYCGEVKLSACATDDERHRVASVYAQLHTLRHSVIHPKESEIPESYQAAIAGSRLARPVNIDKGIPDDTGNQTTLNPKEGTRE